MRGARQFWSLVQWQLAELLQQRVGWLLAGLSVALVGSLGTLREFNFGEGEARFFIGVTQVGLVGFGTLFVALLGANGVAQGMAQRTLPTLVARGIGRSAWLMATLAALWIVVGWLVVVLGGALAAMLVWHGHGAAVSEGVRQLGTGAAGLLVLGAAAVFFATVFVRPTAAATATVALSLAAQAAPVLDQAAARGGGGAPLWRLVDWLVPDVVGLGAEPSWLGLAQGGGHAVVFALGAMIVFAKREL